MVGVMNNYISKWQRELDAFSQLNSAIALTGSIYDMVPIYKNGSLARLTTLDQYLCSTLLHNGYRHVLSYDMVRGFSELSPVQEGTYTGIQILRGLIRQEAHSLQSQSQNGSREMSYTIQQFGQQTFLRPESPEDAARMIQILMNYSNESLGMIVRFTSQLVARPDDLDQEERRMFLYLRCACENARRYHAGDPQKTGYDKNPMIQNQLFLLTDKLNDLPAWFSISFPQLKVIHLERPDYRERELFVRGISSYFRGYQEAGEEMRKRFLDRCVGQTEGLTYTDLNHIRLIASRQRIEVEQVDKAIMLYRHGIRDNPWTMLRDEDLSDMETVIKERVKGQDNVVRQAVDIIKRAVVGMSGLQHSSASSKPRGILFLAGPTGTGKTELAKAITERLFKDERNMIRFDMSEYRQEQSDQRLLGAPPGYVGYEAGGQLTNAVREHPFSVLLFDEIEKAHPSLMDKFLQILEDGRITDGRGETVYFQDCIIIFTSNLGITRPSPSEPGKRIPNVSYETDRDYESVRTKVLAGVRSYFNDELGRPELLNRIGNNILVFDFIREETMRGILQKQIRGICTQMEDKLGIRLIFNQTAVNKIDGFALAQLPLGQGGRGIGNVVEEKVINPLARYVFDAHVSSGETITVQDIRIDEFGLPDVLVKRSRSI